MSSKKIFVALFLMTLVLAAVKSLAQANVNETENAVVYVDATLGSDGGSGSQLSPLQTIGAAVAVAKANNVKHIGTRVLINPGTYREFVNLQATWQETNAPMTFQAVVPGTAVIAGSDLITGWTVENGGKIYSHAWDYPSGACAVPTGWPTTFAPISLQTEMFFVNHNPLTQILSSSDMREGTFFIDLPNHLVHIWPSHVAVMSWAVVEAAVRPQTLSVNGVSNVVFRGLVFQHARNCINTSGALITNSDNILFDNVQAVWNNWGGLGITHSNQFTVKNSVASHNGGVGFAGTNDTNALFDTNETDANNWRGAMSALYDWGMGGIKLMLTHTATVNNHTSINNQAQGLWFDTDNKNIFIDNATLVNNVMGSFQIEASEGPVSITNSRACSSGNGLNVINTAGLTVKNNIFYENSGTGKYQAQIFMAGKPGGRQINDWETGQPYTIFTSNTTLTGNTFIDSGPPQYVFSTYLSGNDWSQFTSTLNSNSNNWFDPATTKAFKIPGAKLADLAGWQNATHEDLGSLWVSPANVAAACVVPIPAFTDFQMNVDKMVYTMVGGQAVATIRIDSFGYGPVSLTTSGLPAGVTASFDQSRFVDGVAVLTLTASKTAPVQSSTFTIFANSGSRVHPVTVTLNVVPSP